MKSNDDERRTLCSNKRKRKATLFLVCSSLKKLLERCEKTRTEPLRRQRFNADVCGMTCNNAYALPKTTSDLCRQELMEKRLRASRFCCQARRVQIAPSQSEPTPASAPSTLCSSCPTTCQTRGPTLPNGGQTRSLPCQALPPPPPCAPKCPPRPPCPPTLSTPLKASDYIHTTTECYPNNTQDDPCRWDNTTCYNEGNDASGNTIRQWNTRCQFASNSTGAICDGSSGGSANNRVMAAAGGGGGPIPSSLAGPTPASLINKSNNDGGGGGAGGGVVGNGGGAIGADISSADISAGTLSDPIPSDLNHGLINSRATNVSVCPHGCCRSAVAAAAAASDHRFRKCKKELMIRFPSGKCGTELQLRRSAKLGNLMTPPRTTTARPDIAPTTAAAATSFATRSRLPPLDVNSVAKHLLVESPMSTTRAPILSSTPLTPLSPAASASAASIHYYPQVSLIDDDMPPVSVSRPHLQADTSIFTNRASQLRWLRNQRKLHLPANKRTSSSSLSPPPIDFFKNDFDYGHSRRIKR